MTEERPIAAIAGAFPVIAGLTRNPPRRQLGASLLLRWYLNDKMAREALKNPLAFVAGENANFRLRKLTAFSWFPKGEALWSQGLALLVCEVKAGVLLPREAKG